jgi:hypothetical protein
MTRNKLAANASVDDSASYRTAAVTPSADALVLLFVTSAQGVFSVGTPNVPDITGNGLAWTAVDTLTFGAQDNRRLTCFRALGAAVAGSVTIDFGGQTQDYCAWSLMEYTGVDTAEAGVKAVAAVGSAKGNGAALTVPLGASADAARNTRVGGIALELIGEPDVPVDPGAGFAEIDELNPDQLFQKGTTLQTQDGPATATAAWTWTGVKNAGAIVVEVKAAPLQPPQPGEDVVTAEKVMRRFEPILFFHPEETFFPVDAKRYIERAQLWKAATPPDDPTGWTSVTPAGKVAAASGEPGSYPFGMPLGADGDNRFLELGGWTDGDGTHETDVTPANTNRYADRDEIAKIYRTTLAASRFWYHAELFDGQRLNHAAGRSDLDLTRILKRFTNPRLLCYYFFYPAHQQSVGAGGCENVEAREVSSHAGDWQCVAVLLEGDSASSLEGLAPRFLGITGSRPAATGPEEAPEYAPHASDADGLTVIKVQKWGSGLELTGEHPRFFVARGSHGMYTAPGEHDVDPYDSASAPRQCGTQDTPGVAVPADFPEPGSPWIPAAIIAKLLTSGAFPLGLLGGLTAIVAEVFTLPGFGTSAPVATPPNPDATPAEAGRGKTLRPAGLAVPGAGPDVADWQSRRALVLNGRTYDFVVDRETQKWWPGDDGEQGFFGRWGQHVAGDRLPRRAGPRFPDYARMFLEALADGDNRDLLDLDG